MISLVSSKKNPLINTPTLYNRLAITICMFDWRFAFLLNNTKIYIAVTATSGFRIEVYNFSYDYHVYNVFFNKNVLKCYHTDLELLANFAKRGQLWFITWGEITFQKVHSLRVYIRLRCRRLMIASFMGPTNLQRNYTCAWKLSLGPFTQKTMYTKFFISNRNVRLTQAETPRILKRIRGLFCPGNKIMKPTRIL